MRKHRHRGEQGAFLLTCDACERVTLSLRLGEKINRLLKHLVAQPAMCDLHRLAHKGHQQGIGLYHEGLEELVFLGTTPSGAGGADRPFRGARVLPGADGELAPAGDARGAVGADADAFTYALEVGWVCDLLGQTGSECDELEDLVAGNGTGGVSDGEEGIIAGVSGGSRLFKARQSAEVANDGMDSLQIGDNDGRGDS